MRKSACVNQNAGISQDIFEILALTLDFTQILLFSHFDIFLLQRGEPPCG